jgi:hypothetical protein
MGAGFFLGVKRPRRGVDNPLPSSAKVKGRVKLYICSPSGPSWPVLGWTSIFWGVGVGKGVYPVNVVVLFTHDSVNTHLITKTHWEWELVQFELCWLPPRCSDIIVIANMSLCFSTHSITVSLTFMGPCITNVFQYISNNMQLYAVYLYLKTTLHVSGVTSTHHQERKQLYLQHLVFVTPLRIVGYILEYKQLVYSFKNTTVVYDISI